jgi:hypothetical protein
MAALIGTRSLSVKTYRSFLLYFQLQSVSTKTKSRNSLQISSVNTSWLELVELLCPAVFTISEGETVSVVTGFLVFINECIELFC